MLTFCIVSCIYWVLHYVQPLLCPVLRTVLWPIVYSRVKLFFTALFYGPPLASSVCVRGRGWEANGHYLQHGTLGLCFEITLAMRAKENKSYGAIIKTFSMNRSVGRFSLEVVMSIPCLSVRLSVHILKPCFSVEWRFLVKERITYFGIPLDIFGFLLFQWFFSFEIFQGFLVFGNQPTVHSEGVN